MPRTKPKTDEEIAGEVFQRIQNFRTNGKPVNFACDLGKDATGVINIVNKLLTLYYANPVEVVFMGGEWRVREKESL